MVHNENNLTNMNFYLGWCKNEVINRNSNHFLCGGHEINTQKHLSIFGYHKTDLMNIGRNSKKLTITCSTFRLNKK